MRIVAWLLVFVTVCVGALIAYSLYAAELSVTPVELRVVPASEMSEQFQAAKQAVAERSLLGRQFQEGEIGDSYAYEFHIYTVQLHNRGFIPADWIRLEVQPGVGDVLQIESEGAHSLPSVTSGQFNSGQIQAVVLAQKGADTARQLSLTYFIWSRPYTLVFSQQ